MMPSKPSQHNEPTPPELALTRLTPNPDPGTNTPPPQTIIFLHGGESCALEFSRVAPLLQDTYETILVDLPGHSRSAAIPFSFDNAVRGIVYIIETQITAKKAHIAGLSLGGYIGLELARQRPDLVLSLWCTGCAPLSGFGRWMRARSTLLSGLITLVGRIGTESVFWASLGRDLVPIPGLRVEVQKNQNMSTLKPVFDELVTFTMKNLEEIKGVRVAIVAGGKGDSVRETVEAGRVLRAGNEECDTFVVRDAIHWWSLQMPEVFAEGVRAWVERREMPKEFEPLL